MSRRKKSHQSHGTPNRPRLWGKHAVAAALDNPERKVLKAWATREAAGFMQFPKEVPVTLADVADLGRLVPHDAPHQGVVVELEPLEEIWLGDMLGDAAQRRRPKAARLPKQLRERWSASRGRGWSISPGRSRRSEKPVSGGSGSREKRRW